MKELLNLFLVFAKIGVTTFGGGYAMLPILHREIVEERGWAEEEELVDYFAIGQCTPGVIAVNTATFIGYKRKGVIGGIFATLGVIFPSLVIIAAIAASLQTFSEIPAVKNAFAGIRVAVCVLILNVVLKLLRQAIIDMPTAFIFTAVLLISIFTGTSPVVFVLASAFFGIIARTIAEKKEVK